MRWAVAGFVGGFLLCYLLIGTSQSPRPASPPLALVTPPVAPEVQVTKLVLPKFHTESPARWLGPGPAPNRPHPGYSLDLIDDVHRQ
jgi:hypothetical protein